MNLFACVEQEERMCGILRCYIEEWGPENVVVGLPRSWSRYVSAENIGRVRLSFETDDTVCIQVRCGDVAFGQSFGLA
jgi:hypothetical protein